MAINDKSNCNTIILDYSKLNVVKPTAYGTSCPHLYQAMINQ